MSGNPGRTTNITGSLNSRPGETKCSDADCTFPTCGCWERKRRNCPSRIPVLEAALSNLVEQIGQADGTAQISLEQAEIALKY
jgi:hypothetical protein